MTGSVCAERLRIAGLHFQNPSLSNLIGELRTAVELLDDELDLFKSRAVFHHLFSKADRITGCPVREAKVQMICGCVDDLYESGLFKLPSDIDAAESILAPMWNKIEILVQSGGAAIDGTSTLADLYVAVLAHHLMTAFPKIDFSSKCPKLSAIHKAMYDKNDGKSPAKVTYFNINGRGEYIRVAMRLFNIPFEDFRVEFGEWMTVKGKTPFGQLPMFEEDGVRLCQTRSIVHYIFNGARRMSPCPVREAKVQMICGCVDDICEAAFELYADMERPKDAHEALVEKLRTQTIPPLCENLEKLLASTSGSKRFAVGNSVSMADVYVAVLATQLLKGDYEFSAKGTSLISSAKHPNILEIQDAIYCHEDVASFASKEH